jgi:hypothetical protein
VRVCITALRRSTTARLLAPVLLAAAVGGGTAGTAIAAAPRAAGDANPTPVSVYPSPGTPTAAPRTQISVRGAPAQRLRRLTVTGSRTGRHRGRLRAHRDGNGASFLPRRPFSPGERVTVRTGLPTVGARQGMVQFGVARPAPPLPIKHQAPALRQASDTLRYRSRPDLAPPRARVVMRAPGVSPGHIFMAPNNGEDAQDGPLIIDDTGEPILFLPLKRKVMNFRVQTFRGKPVLTWWEGAIVLPGAGNGTYVIRDDAYEPIARVRPGNGYRGDHHEFLITPRDTALILSYQPVWSEIGSGRSARRAVVLDQIVQEVDIATGLVLFEWHALGNIALDESYGDVPRSATHPYDYAHLNSIDEDVDGDLLISARNTHAVYKLDRQTGAIEWRLGGKRSTFRLGRGVRFAWQHDARRQLDGTISILDNASSPPMASQSRGIVVALDPVSRRATLRRQFTRTPPVLSWAEANMQVLPTGNVMIGWGAVPSLSEHAPDGRQLLLMRFPRGDDSYRTFRFPWVGRPRTRPALAASRRGRTVEAAVSWNGATEVAGWELLGGRTPGTLRPLGRAFRAGFETVLRTSTAPRFVAVRALDAAGRPLGQSAVVRPRRPNTGDRGRAR